MQRAARARSELVALRYQVNTTLDISRISSMLFAARLEFLAFQNRLIGHRKCENRGESVDFFFLSKLNEGSTLF